MHPRIEEEMQLRSFVFFDYRKSIGNIRTCIVKFSLSGNIVWVNKAHNEYFFFVPIFLEFIGLKKGVHTDKRDIIGIPFLGKELESMAVGITLYHGGTGHISEPLKHPEIVSEILRENGESIEIMIRHRNN